MSLESRVWTVTEPSSHVFWKLWPTAFRLQFPKCNFPKCNFPNCNFPKCTRLTHLLSFASLFQPMLSNAHISNSHFAYICSVYICTWKDSGISLLDSSNNLVQSQKYNYLLEAPLPQSWKELEGWKVELCRLCLHKSFLHLSSCWSKSYESNYLKIPHTRDWELDSHATALGNRGQIWEIIELKRGHLVAGHSHTVVKLACRELAEPASAA